MKILGTGLSGLVGSRVASLLEPKYTFENLSLSTGLDITKEKEVLSKISSSDAPVVLHFAAKADVDACEKDKDLAWAVNVIGTKNIVLACEQTNKKLIHISTDFVFDGEKEFYTEEDEPNPINWYGKTKHEAEKIVMGTKVPWEIVRIAYPYRAKFLRNDFVRSILSKLNSGQKVYAISNHVMTPTFIDDIALSLDSLISANHSGIFHVVGSQFVTPFEAAEAIASKFGQPLSQIVKIDREEYFRNRAPRPFRLGLRNDKILRLNIKPKTLEEGLDEIKRQITI